MKLKITAGRLRHLDVVPKYPRHAERAGEIDYAVDARPESRKIVYLEIEPAGIQEIAGQQQVRAPIEHRNLGGLVTRRRDDIEDPAAQIVRYDFLRP